MEFSGVAGTETWLTLHTHVTFVAPTSRNTRQMCRQAFLYSVGLFPAAVCTVPDHGYQNPSISCIGRSITGPPNRLICRAYLVMYASHAPSAIRLRLYCGWSFTIVPNTAGGFHGSHVTIGTMPRSNSHAASSTGKSGCPDHSWYHMRTAGLRPT